MTPAQQTIRTWRENPVKFVWDNFQVDPDGFQVELLEAFADPYKRRISQQACAGPGKSAGMAWCGWNFISCYGNKDDHPRGAAISVNRDNLKAGLWAEMSKWQQKSPYLTEAFTWTQSRIYANDHPSTWFMDFRGWPKDSNTEEQGKTLSGLHSAFLLFLIDESGAIPTTVLRAANQGLGSAGIVFAKIIQSGNPISLEGMLYAAYTLLRDQWHVIIVNGDPDDPHSWVNGKRALATHISDEANCGCPRCENRRQINAYGRENPWVMSYILGKFPPSSINSFLAPEQVEAAMKLEYDESVYKWAQSRLGVDVARFGDDRTVIFPRQGKRAFLPTIMRHARDSAVSTDIATRILDVKSQRRAELVLMDATGGWAAGARDVLAALEPSKPPISIQFHAPSADKKYRNRRAFNWWHMAEWVKNGGWLPKLPELIAELSQPTYTYTGAALLVEPKEQVKSRLGRSPDLADALSVTFGIPDSAPLEAKQARDAARLSQQRQYADEGGWG